MPLKTSPSNNLTNEVLAYQWNTFYYWKILKNKSFWLSLIFYNLQNKIVKQYKISCKNIKDTKLNNMCNEMNILNKATYKNYKVN